jgi:hypothetical protein
VLSPMKHTNKNPAEAGSVVEASGGDLCPHTVLVSRQKTLYGAFTVRMYQGNESQLKTFSVPSNSVAILPPPAL